MSAPSEQDMLNELPPPREAPTFSVDDWKKENEPSGMTKLDNGETFLDGVQRVAEKLGDTSAVSKGCNSMLPGMRVAGDQVGVVLVNGSVRLRPSGAYRSTMFNPWKQIGGVIPVSRAAGVEFDPLEQVAKFNRGFADLKLGQSYRQVVLQAQQVGVFEDHTDMRLVGQGTYVYGAETSLRGVVNLNRMKPVLVQRETEDTVAANKTGGVVTNQHGRLVPAEQGHGTTVKTTKRVIPAGYFTTVAGFGIARPEKGFVVLHKDANNNISMTEGICLATGKDDFVRRSANNNLYAEELEIEFGDLNHYAKSTPMLELKSRDNLDALCRVQIKWAQTRPDLWVSHRGAFTDPFDMLEEKCANMMRDWLLSVAYLEALAEKSQGFTKVEHQWTTELNETGHEYGVKVLSLEITTLRFPSIDKQDELVAEQLAETNLAIESSRQNASKEIELSKLNQATHVRLQQDRDREAEAEERAQLVERRKDVAKAETVTKKAEMDTKIVEASKALALAEELKDKEVFLAKATAEAEAERVRAQGKRDAARLAAEGEIAATTQKNDAQIRFLKEQAELLRGNPGLVELLRLQNDLLKTQALANAAVSNPNIVLLPGQEGLEARRMNNGHAPQVPGNASIMTTLEKN